MKIRISNKMVVCFLLWLATAVAFAAESKTREVHFRQDDAQYPMVSKVYELKHVAANDLTPFVLSAVYRYDTNSKVDRLRYSVGKKEFLVVSTPPIMMPYVDEMVRMMDRPSKIVGINGSGINGTGVYRFTYMPQYRSSEDMVNIANRAIRWMGIVFRDPVSNLIYWKECESIGRYMYLWMKAFDRPLPQVEMVFRVYQVRTATLRDLGMDYLGWKNGPGLNIFSAGLQATSVESVEKQLSQMNQLDAWAFGGFYFAPQFDASFIRLLSQQGEAEIVSSGTLTMVNNPLGEYYVKLIPENQNIDKSVTLQAKVDIGSSEQSMLKIRSPLICFRRLGEIDRVYNGEGFDMTTYSNLDGVVRFDFEMTTTGAVERGNLGQELVEQSNIQSSMTLDIDTEHLLAVCSKEQAVTQTIGMPFLSSVPWLKYLFSSEETVYEHNKLFITVRARLVHPDDAYAAWSGKLMKTGEFINADFPAEEP